MPLDVRLRSATAQPCRSLASLRTLDMTGSASRQCRWCSSPRRTRRRSSRSKCARPAIRAVVTAAVRRAISAVDPGLPLREIFTIEQLVDSSLARERLMARLSSVARRAGTRVGVRRHLRSARAARRAPHQRNRNSNGPRCGTASGDRNRHARDRRPRDPWCRDWRCRSRMGDADHIQPLVRCRAERSGFTRCRPRPVLSSRRSPRRGCLRTGRRASRRSKRSSETDRPNG